MQQTLVVLLHGFNKGPADMGILAKAMRRRGYAVAAPRLPTLFGSLEDCVASLEHQVAAQMSRYPEVFFVAHSMGGIIAETYLHNTRPSNLVARIYIASPFGGARLAAMGRRIPLFAKIFRPILCLSEGYSQRPGISNSRLGIICGCKSDLLLGKLLLRDTNDGRVEVASTRMPGASDSIVLHHNHKAIHGSEECIDQVLWFMEHGMFRRADSSQQMRMSDP